MVDAGENVSLTLKREFGEEALNALEEDVKETTKRYIEELFQHGVEVGFLFLSKYFEKKCIVWSHF